MCLKAASARNWMPCISFTRATAYRCSADDRREDGRDYIRWCFADPGVAAEFADEFGGTIGEQHAN